MMALLELENVTKVYRVNGRELRALDGISLSVEKEDDLAIVGASGSGKTTLLYLMGLLDAPSSGLRRFEGRSPEAMTERELREIRGRRIGFVFQNYCLAGTLTARENVELPLLYAGVGERERRRRAEEALEAVGLSQRAGHLPGQLSGGQQQRVAIARAVVTHPGLLLADEPTGNLDPDSGREVLELLRSCLGEGGALVVITHDAGVAATARRRITLRGGVCVSPEEPPSALKS